MRTVHIVTAEQKHTADKGFANGLSNRFGSEHPLNMERLVDLFKKTYILSESLSVRVFNAWKEVPLAEVTEQALLDEDTIVEARGVGKPGSFHEGKTLVAYVMYL